VLRRQQGRARARFRLSSPASSWKPCLRRKELAAAIVRLDAGDQPRATVVGAAGVDEPSVRAEPRLVPDPARADEHDIATSFATTPEKSRPEVAATCRPSKNLAFGEQPPPDPLGAPARCVRTSTTQSSVGVFATYKMLRRPRLSVKTATLRLSTT
jgi:hypothetical protein